MLKDKTFYTFDISNFEGKRYKYEKKEMKKYLKCLNSNGNIFIYGSGDTYINFRISSKLIRELKLKELSNNKKSTTDYYIKLIINMSNEVEDEKSFTSSYCYWYNYDPSYNDYNNSIDYINENNNSKRIYSNKISNQLKKHSNKYKR